MVFTSAIGRSESRGTHNGGDAVGHAGGIAVRAHRHIYPGPRTLRKRHDDFRPLPILRVWSAHVLVNTDDLPVDHRPEFRRARNNLAHGNALCQRIDIGQVFSGQFLIDDRHRHASGGVRFGQCAPACDAYAKRGEIARCGHIEAGTRALCWVGHFPTDDIEIHTEVHSRHRHTGGHR